ncbi:hypothetical protein LXA43DRAFT_1068291 [Ganoderma leucocontextum]|nr:hypothetical protein LXA43DRAFT_1068291 [Ganoderma leucocontextum]
MSTPRPRPRRTNANLRPADVVLAGKQTRRSTAEVAQEKAALEAQRQALLQKQEAELEKLRQLELQLNAQAQENEEHAARPPPAQPAPTTRRTRHVPDPSAPSGTTTPTPPTRAAAADAQMSAPVPGSGQASAERKVQPGRVRKITRGDVEAYRMGGATTGLDHAGGGASKENAASSQTAPNPSAPAVPGSNKGKKRQSDVGVEPSPAKKISATAPSQPHGVYAQSTGVPELDDFEDSSSALVERPPPPALTLNVDGPTNSVPKTRNVIQLEVVDVAEGPTVAAAASVPATATTQPPQQAPLIPVPAPPAAPEAAGGQWAMRDLEPMLGPYLGSFSATFVPKLINLTGNLANGPWSLHGLDLKGAMEGLAAEVWPMLNVVVIPRQVFFDMAKQKLWEYRNGVANEAIDVVTTYMLSRRFEGTEARADYVSWALSEKDNWPFRYSRVVETEDGMIKNYGAYQSTLVSRVLAYHLKRIHISANQIRDHPCNALALAVTAVERALKMWSTGSLQRPRGRSEEAKFSERLWGRIANEYLGGIIDISDEQWDDILAKAELCARGLDEDSDDELDDETERPEDLPTTGRAVLMDAEVENREREGRGGGYLRPAVARSRNGEDITVSSDCPSKERHASRPSKDIHNIPTTEGADPSGGGALGRPAPRLPRGHAADFKKPPYREGGTLASQPDNKHHKSPAQEEREELAKVLVGMGLDDKLPLSRHEMPSFKKKSKTKAM